MFGCLVLCTLICSYSIPFLISDSQSGKEFQGWVSFYSYISAKTKQSNKKFTEVNMTLWTQIFQLFLDVVFQVYTLLKSKEILPTMIIVCFLDTDSLYFSKIGHDSLKVKNWSPYVFINDRIHALMGFNETLHIAPHIQSCIYLEKKSQLYGDMETQRLENWRKLKNLSMTRLEELSLGRNNVLISGNENKGMDILRTIFVIVFSFHF